MVNKELRLVGIKDDMIMFEEIEEISDYLEGKNWKLKFRKADDNQGWHISWLKEQK